jgi:predicted RNA-binding protein with PIN domain
MSARTFHQEVEETEARIKKAISDYNIKETDKDFLKTIKEKLDEGKK